MRLNSNSLFRNFFLLMALISSLLLTACGGGGGGGGSTAPATQTANVKVIIPGSLFPQQAKEIRAATSLETLTLKVVAYSNGKEKTDVKITDRKATSNGIDFIASVDGLLNVYDYRFKVFHKNVELLSNQVDASEIVNDANITINIETSYKTIAYDSWLKKKPTNASMKNFKANSKSAGFTKDADYKKLTLQVGSNNYTADQYQENLIKAAKGESATLPTSSTAKINVDKIATTDKEAEIVTYTISYNLDGGTVSKTNPTKYDSTSATITLNNPTKNGYDFTGWTGSNGNTPQTSVTIAKGSTGNKTYTANWKAKQTSNNSLIGTWYLNEEDGKPVVPNSNGEVETMILNSDGNCSMTDYGLTDKNHLDYWETQQSEGTEKGKWKYTNNKLYVTIDGVERSFDTSISNDTLTIKGKYENSNETWVSVYKKTKYKLELYSGGSGTKSDPYIIAKAKDLYNVRFNLSSHYTQTKDIDLSEYGKNYTAEFRGISGKGWLPIGGSDASDKSTYFTGSYNGNGYKITNLYINRAAPGQGLFSILGEGGNLKGINIIVHSDGITGTGIIGCLVALAAPSSEISNCNVQKANLTGFQESIGGLVGWSESNISNCSVEGSISVYILNDDSEGGVGGLVGKFTGTGNITNSKVECAINSKTGNVGGLIGASKTSGYIKNCTAYGTVLCNENVNAGGLIGNNSSTVEYCIAEVAVVGCYGCGGFVGVNSGEISKCYSTGNVGSVSSSNCGFTGGFAGTNSNQITDCYSLTEAVFAKSDNSSKSAGPVSCLVGYNLENGIINRCYATGKASCASIGSGGIVGWNKGEVKNSFALCDSVLSLNGEVGRIAAYNDGIINYCYAISTMTVNQSIPSTNTGTTKINGETVTASTCQNKSWWTNILGFNSSIWRYSTTNKRMELINMPSLE